MEKIQPKITRKLQLDSSVGSHLLLFLGKLPLVLWGRCFVRNRDMWFVSESRIVCFVADVTFFFHEANITKNDRNLDKANITKNHRNFHKANITKNQ